MEERKNEINKRQWISANPVISHTFESRRQCLIEFLKGGKNENKPWYSVKDTNPFKQIGRRDEFS